MKMKTVIRFLEILILVFILTGCESANIEPYVHNEPIESSSYFKTLSKERYGIVVYDTRTGVEYWISEASYNCGDLTLLVDKDGKPLIYTESEEE